MQWCEEGWRSLLRDGDWGNPVHTVWNPRGDS